MNKFFTTSRGSMINVEAIGLITPLTVSEYIERYDDKKLAHTPYSPEALKQWGFHYAHEYQFVRAELHEALEACNTDPKCWTNVFTKAGFLKPGRVAGYWRECTEEPVKLCSMKISGEHSDCIKESDDLYFLPEEKRSIPFVYILHLMMGDGGMNCSHTKVLISADDFKILKILLGQSF